LEQCVRKITVPYVNIVCEVDKIGVLLLCRNKVETALDSPVFSTIEERLIMLERSQQDLAREVSELKAIVAELYGRIG
jgi:hypothetical protein